jgi:hypothetical protein
MVGDLVDFVAETVEEVYDRLVTLNTIRDDDPDGGSHIAGLLVDLSELAATFARGEAPPEDLPL